MEILFRKRDKVNPNSEQLNKQLLKAGDAVACVEDGHPWTARELTNPDWRIARISNNNRQLVRSLLESGEVVRRVNKFDASKIKSQTFIDAWNDDSRSVAIIDLSNINIDLQSLIKAKP